jgi:uncharacterized membrane protein YhaH (DUF805 family)
LPALALGIKRFHDLGMTGWWMSPLTPAFFLYHESFEAFQNLAYAIGSWIYLSVFWVIVVIVLSLMQLFVEGNLGENQYGQDPLERR